MASTALLWSLAAAWPRAAAQTAATPAFSDEARRRLTPGSDSERVRFESDRQDLLDEAQRQLDRGEADAALQTLERAALMRHAADTELAYVRALMAAGKYQRALVAGAHTAGAHREQVAGTALYGWLLHVGGQELAARRYLDEALNRSPEEALLLHTREQLTADWPRAGDLLRQGPWHAAPQPHGSSPLDIPPDGVRAIGTALLLSGGDEALVARAAAPAGAVLWLRNGLGRTMAVAERRATSDADLDLLTLRDALPPPTWQAAPREPFAGSPGFMVEYAPDTRGLAAWPLLRQGFFAGIPGTLPSRPLGLAAPAGPRGGPVLDATGQLVGLALEGVAVGTASPLAGRAVDRLLPLARLRAARGAGVPEPAVRPIGPPAPRVGPEVAYEHALRGALQVLALNKAGHA